MTSVGLQLYTVRDVPEALPDLLERVATAGFEGVEFASRVHDESPASTRRALERTGLHPIGMHVDLAMLRTNRIEVLSLAEQLDVDRIIIPHLSIETFRTIDRLEAVGRTLVDLAWDLADRDMTLMVHTTRELLLPYFDVPGLSTVLATDGMPKGAYIHLAWMGSTLVPRNHVTLRERSPLGRLSTQTSAVPLEFEFDVKSAVSSGFDVGTVLDVLGGRAPMVHLSDVVRSRRLPPAYRAVDPGDGLVDVNEVIDEVTRRRIDWLIVEHDDPADPLATLERVAAITQAAHTSLQAVGQVD